MVIPQVSDYRAEYNKLKKINEEEEDRLQAQIKGLQMELEEKRFENRSKEGLIERELAERMTLINDLRESIQSKEVEFCDRKISVSSCYPPSAPADHYEPLYNLPTSPAHSHQLEEPSQPSPTYLSPASKTCLGKSMDSLTSSEAAGTTHKATHSRRKYVR